MKNNRKVAEAYRNFLELNRKAIF